MTNTPPPRTICRSCHRPLDALLSGDGELTYYHALLPEQAFGPCDSLDPMEVGGDVGDTIGVCDFCSAPLPRWNYPCADFELPSPGSPLGYVSQGDWGACDQCHELIELNHYAELAHRSLDRMPPAQRPIAERSIRAMQRGFKTHRVGPAVELWAEL